MADMEINISINNLKNAVLARDVVTETGFILVTKDTMLNDRMINKLIEMGIQSVFVKTVDYKADAIRGKQGPITRGDYIKNLRIDYNRFKGQHDQCVENVNKSLSNIGSGGAVDVNKAFEISDEIMSQLQLKTDVLAYLSFLETSGDSIFTHSLNVSLLCNLFGRWLGMQLEQLINLTTAGLLHDIGKTRILAQILNKKGKLTDAEYDEIKNHTIYGYEIIKDQDLNDEIKRAVLFHHERIDGSGYPYGILGNEMGEYAKIVAICDVYDAMTTDRVFRPKICPFKVIRDFETMRYSEFDTYYLIIFLKNIAYAYVSSDVLLSNGKRGEIVFINANQLSRPIVLVEGKFFDLAKNPGLEIIEIV